MSFRAYQATPEAIKQGRSIGIYGNTAARLARAAKRSAQFTGDLGNRRFLNFVLTLHGEKIVWVNLLAA